MKPKLLLAGMSVILLLVFSCSENDDVPYLAPFDPAKAVIGKWELAETLDRHIDGKDIYRQALPGEKSTLEFWEDSVVIKGYFDDGGNLVLQDTGKYWLIRNGIFYDSFIGPWIYQFSENNDTLLLKNGFPALNAISDKYLRQE